MMVCLNEQAQSVEKRLEFAELDRKGQAEEGLQLSELEASDEFSRDGGDALLGRLRERSSRLGVGIAENDPDARAVGLVAARTDRAGELREFERQRRRMGEIEFRVLGRIRLERRVGEEIHEHAAGVINEVAETL